MYKNFSKKLGITLGVLTSLFLLSFVVFSFTPPSTLPTAGNILPPIDITGTAQHKEGALGIGGILTANTGMIINPYNFHSERPTCNADARGTIWTENKIEGTTNLVPDPMFELGIATSSGNRWYHPYPSKTHEINVDNGILYHRGDSEGELGVRINTGDITLDRTKGYSLSFKVRIITNENGNLGEFWIHGPIADNFSPAQMRLHDSTYLVRKDTLSDGFEYREYYLPPDTMEGSEDTARFGIWWGWNSAGLIEYQLKEFQVEQKPYATPFVDGTREEVPSDIIYTCQKLDNDSYQWQETGPNWRKEVATTLTDGLVGHWTFNEAPDSGNFTYDYSGNQNTARSFGPYLDFDGESDYILIGENDKRISIENKFTISAWFNASLVETGEGEDDPLYIYGNTQHSSDRVFLRVKSGKVDFGIYDGSWGQDRGVGATIEPGRWYHVVGVHGGGGRGDYTLYLNGQEINESFSTGGVQNTFQQTIGSDPSGGRNWDGKISNVQIYNRALSASEIKQLYEGRYHDTTGLVGHWRMSEGANGTCPGGADVCDHSGNENHGTNNGATWGDNAPTRVPQGQGHAFDFQSNVKYLSSVDNFELPDNFSISGWVNIHSVNDGATTRPLVAIFKDNDNFLYFGYFDDNNEIRTWSSGISPSPSIVGSFAQSANTWYHFTWTFDGSTLRQYVDAVEDGNRSTNLSGFSGHLLFGVRGTLAQPFQGIADDVRIYNRALSAEEIKYLYETTAPNYE